MKISHKVALIFFSIILLSCNNDDTPRNPDFITSQINEVLWNGVPEVYLNQFNDTLKVLGSGSEKVLLFKIKFTGEGIYNLTGDQVIYYTTLGGDIITSSYALDGDKSSRVTISSSNSENNIVGGNFQLSLRQEWSILDDDDESLSITNGKFKGTIISE